MAATDLTGMWLSRYTYHGGASSEHVVLFEARDGLIVGNGKDEMGSRLTLELEYDGENKVLTGKWREATSPSGEYAGAVFHGAVQFILSEDYDKAEGRWVGFNSRRGKVNTGEWSLTRV
jgi:hypothetical protein